MDKLQKVLQAEQYLPKNILYGTKNGVLIKDFIEQYAEKFVIDESTPSSLAEDIKNTVMDSPDFVELIKSIPNELPSEEIFEPNGKELFIENFIKKIPYSGEIYHTPEMIISIAEELRKLKLDDQFHVEIGFGGESVPIGKIYKDIILNEWVKPSYIDKEQAVIGVIGELRVDNPDIDDIIKNDPDFQQICNNINDHMQVQIGEEQIDIHKYIMEIYNRRKERDYNSVDSKPSMVETIGLERGSNGLEVTNSYIFLTPEEAASIVNREYTYSTTDKLRKLLEGLTQSVDSSLPLYEKEIVESTKGESSPLAERIVKELVDKKREAATMQDNLDNLELMLGERIKDVNERLTQLYQKYSREIQVTPKEITDIEEEIFNIRKLAESANLPNNTDIDTLFQLLNNLSIKIDKVKDNVNRNREKITRYLEDRRHEIGCDIRKMLGASSAPTIAGYEVRISDEIKAYGDAIEKNKGYFTEDEIHDFKVELDRMLEKYNYEYEGARRYL